MTPYVVRLLGALFITLFLLAAAMLLRGVEEWVGRRDGGRVVDLRQRWSD